MIEIRVRRSCTECEFDPSYGYTHRPDRPEPCPGCNGSGKVESWEPLVETVAEGLQAGAREAKVSVYLDKEKIAEHVVKDVNTPEGGDPEGYH